MKFNLVQFAASLFVPKISDAHYIVKKGNTSSFLCIKVSLLLKICIFLNSVLRPFQDYFSSYETGQSVVGAKTGELREKPPGTPASRTWFVSHVARAGLEPTPDTAVR